MKSKRLIVILCSLALSVSAFTGITFAWINTQAALNSPISVDSSSLAVNSISATVYKYVYPSFTNAMSEYDINYHVLDGEGQPTTEEVLINYNQTGEVRSQELTSTYPIGMNVFDPQYLLLNRYNSDGSETISALNTNMVVGVDFNLTYSFPVCVSVQVAKKTQQTSYLAGTNYLHYSAVLASDLTSLDSSSTDGEIFDAVKDYAEVTAENHTFAHDDLNADNKLDMLESANIGEDAVPTQTTTTFRVYLAIDFDDVQTGVKKYDTDGTTIINDYESGLFGLDYLGKTLSVEMDYFFTLCISQREAA